MKITGQELREKFLAYFQKNNHAIISSASLIPENDPTVLFTTAGMHPLVPYLMGEKHPGGTRLANVQKCWRTGDIEEVGDTTHHTFFEMLGNWSLGDYDKTEAIDFAWEFLTKILAIETKYLAVSIFQGDANVTEDKVAYEKWLSLGLDAQRIAKLGINDNWWGPAGSSGPCGPDTEIFYWVGDKKAVPENFDPTDKNWVEIWNNVFMEYNKTLAGQFLALAQKNIDTGMGLERTLAVLNSLADNYLTDLFYPLIQKIEDLSAQKYASDLKSFRVIADHLRSATFLLGDPKGVAPANTGQGYVLRRVIRRAIRFAKNLNIQAGFTTILAQVVIDNFQVTYPELEKNKNFIFTELKKEEEKFSQTLENGLKQFEKLFAANNLNAQTAFELFATYGFPIELTLELAQEKDLQLSEEECRKYHTATHLLHQALRTILGDHVEQRGSNINAERMRFDFVHPDKMTSEQIKQVEDLVNQQIQAKLAMTWQEMTVEEAKNKGAIGLFGHKYGEKVKVYTVGNDANFFSREICGGPHVENTSELGHFKILKEESSSAGIRRIKAILS
ncbi:MAG: Alanine-tRNA ligase [Parcubacteria group bacterium GW2011_GWA2_36_10]|nr:MAG: Alanine-tRNA ligase [Parcubacteria group bacterium GW2011_GWA2_36_10]